MSSKEKDVARQNYDLLEQNDDLRNRVQGDVCLLEVMLLYIDHPESVDKEQLRVNVTRALIKASGK